MHVYWCEEKRGLMACDGKGLEPRDNLCHCSWINYYCHTQPMPS